VSPNDVERQTNPFRAAETRAHRGDELRLRHEPRQRQFQHDAARPRPSLEIELAGNHASIRTSIQIVRLSRQLEDASSPRGLLLMALREGRNATAHLILAGIMTRLLFGENPDPWFRAAVELQAEGVITNEEKIYFLSMFADGVITRAMDQDDQVISLVREMDRIEREHGLDEDQVWQVHLAPEEYQELLRQWDARVDGLTAEAFAEAGAADAAILLRRSSDAFNAAVNRGRTKFDARWNKPKRDPFALFLD
jgi:hypothetical protein